MFDDGNNDGQFNDADAGLGGVAVQLFDEGNPASPVATTTTDGQGFYSFAGLLPGTYRVVQAQPAGYLDGNEVDGNLGGTIDNARDSNTIGGIVLHAGAEGVDYDFAEIRPSRIQSLVWVDFNNDGEVNFGERAIEGVPIALTGTDDRGNPVTLMLTTDAQGLVEFDGLRPGNYTLSETQPAGYPDGRDVPGTVNGVPIGDATVNDQFSGVILPGPGAVGENYNFGERPPADGQLQSGQTAGIGFWHNKHGQALIKSMNGAATETRLGTWLATTFPNMFVQLAGQTNEQVGVYFKTLFATRGDKLEAQVLATAFAVYVTNQMLAGGTYATAYGFVVDGAGTGSRTFNVGSDGAAVGMANGTTATILDILLAVDRRATRTSEPAGFVLYHDDAEGRRMALHLFGLINDLG